MNYHPDDFLALIGEVETQGGSHLSEECRPTKFRLNLPLDDERPDGPRANKTLQTTGCRRHAKFIIQLLPAAYFDLVDVYDTQVTEEIRINHSEGVIERFARPAEADDFDFDDEANPSALMSDGSPALVTVCAVDDAMGLWPRFKDAMHTGDSFQEP